MADRQSAEEMLAKLRALILDARSMPMSASCVINRNEVLGAIDEVVLHLPEEFAEAQHVIDQAQATIAAGQAEAERIISEARTHVGQLAEDSEVVTMARELAARLKAEAETEASDLRRETDVFIDARMASFESVLHKTSSQVKTARLRLSERSALDTR